MVDSLFNMFDCKLIRTASNSEVRLIAVKADSIYLTIDDEQVIVKYDMRGLKLLCSCKNCAVVGVTRDCLCRRRLRTIHWLFLHSGRVSEIMIK